MQHHRLCWIALALYAALFSPARASAADGTDEVSQKVAAYELTMAKVEAYGAAMASLADWAVAHRAEATALNSRAPKGATDLKTTTAFIEKEPAIMAALTAHKLTSLEYVLLPAAIMQASIAALGAQQGRSFPADRINPKNIALVQANQARTDAIMTKVRGDQARLAGSTK